MKTRSIVLFICTTLLCPTIMVSQSADTGANALAVIPQEKKVQTQEKVPPDFVPYDKEPTVVKKVEPEYPPKALKDSLEGNVFLKVLVSISGDVTKAQIIRTDDELFNEAALAAARQWKFTPAILNGKPVAVWVSIPFRFRLRANKGAELKPPPDRTVEELKAKLRLTVLDILAGKDIEQTKPFIDPSAAFIRAGKLENLRTVARRWNEAPEIGSANCLLVRQVVNEDQTAAFVLYEITTNNKNIGRYHTIVFFKATSGQWVIQSWQASD